VGTWSRCAAAEQPLQPVGADPVRGSADTLPRHGLTERFREGSPLAQAAAAAVSVPPQVAAGQIRMPAIAAAAATAVCPDRLRELARADSRRKVADTLDPRLRRPGDRWGNPPGRRT